MNRNLDRLLYIVTALSGFLFFMMVIVSISSRYIFKTPILASIELSRLFFVWSCFLAAAIAYRKKAHVGIHILFDRLSPAVQKWTDVSIHAAILCFVILIGVQSLYVVNQLWQTDLPMLRISQSWFYLALTVSCCFLFFFTLEFLADSVSRVPGKESN